ncbi:MAG TPA: hypothetical protein PK760_15305, partial [Flavobacteriales bacterium]|nr:hypothetical protein [Flavobacteriales bacterium]
RSLEGLQFAGIGNTVWDTLSGVQVAGWVNVVKGGMLGTQISGLCNVTTQDLNGAQIAGLVNVTVHDVQKTQVAGLVNYGRNVEGAQVAGVANTTFGNVGGGQIAGVINAARSVSGGQVSGVINLAIDTVRGAQVGVLNIGRVVRGGQVGVINISDTIVGVSVGVFSFARRGYHRFDVVTDDVLPLTFQLRTGTRAFHNILGYSPGAGTNRDWGFLYGLGTEPRLGKRMFLNIDLSVEQINEGSEWVEAVNQLDRLTIAAGLNIGKHLTISAGPTANMFLTDWRNADTGEYLSRVPPSSVAYHTTKDAVRVDVWPSWRAALGVRF